MMKLIAGISKITALLAIAAVVISCNKEQPKSAASSTDKKAELIVYVNSDSLLNNYEYFNL